MILPIQLHVIFFCAVIHASTHNASIPLEDRKIELGFLNAGYFHFVVFAAAADAFAWTPEPAVRTGGVALERGGSLPLGEGTYVPGSTGGAERCTTRRTRMGNRYIEEGVCGPEGEKDNAVDAYDQ